MVLGALQELAMEMGKPGLPDVGKNCHLDMIMVCTTDKVPAGFHGHVDFIVAEICKGLGSYLQEPELSAGGASHLYATVQISAIGHAFKECNHLILCWRLW